MKKAYHRIGIMGGRLSYSIENKIQSFPKKSWREEFEKASNCGFDLIEWIFDTTENNPILDDEKTKEMKNLSEKYNVAINSVCADYFMEKMLFNVNEFDLEKNFTVLKNLIVRCNKLEIKMLEIPFVDSSSLKNENYKMHLFKNLRQILPLAEENDVILNLETDLPPLQFNEFLNSFNHSNIKANYDVGNSVSLGYDIQEELTIMGNLITNIHIKDRLMHGTTVPLGSGNTNFELFFETVRKIGYKGDFIIQGARENETIIKPENTCKKYLEFVKHYVDKYLL